MDNYIIMDRVKELYEKNGFPGVQKLWQLVIKNKLDVKYKDVQEFLKSQRVAQLHKKAVTHESIPITAPTKLINFQMDLLDMTNSIAKIKVANGFLSLLIFLLDKHLHIP